MNKYKGFIYAILSAICFSLLPVFAKSAYKHGSNPTTVLLARFLLATIFLWLYLKKQKVDLNVTKKQFSMLFFVGLIGYPLTTQTLFVSYSYLGAGLSTALHFIYPAVVCLIGFIFLKEKMSERKLFSLFLSVIGVYALIASESKTLSTLGISLALFSGVSYAVTLVIFSLPSIKSVKHTVSTLYVCFGATLGMLLYGCFTNSIITTLNESLCISYIGIAIISTIASMVLLLKAIEQIGATSASILSTFEPIGSIILGILILGEKLTITLVIGTLLILGSVISLTSEKSN